MRRLDLALCLRLNRAGRFFAIRTVLCAANRLGNGVFWYVLMALLPFLYGEAAWHAMVQMVGAGTLGLAVYFLLKKKTLRKRPYQIDQAIVLLARPLDAFSFPSGHTLHSTAFSLILTTHFPELGPLLFGFSALVALSRPVLGLHFPSDVVAGALLGMGLASLALHI